MTLRISLGELVAAIPLVLDAVPTNAVVAMTITPMGLPTCALMVPRAALLDGDAPVIAAAIAQELAFEYAEVAVLVSFADDDISDGCPALDALGPEVGLVVPHVELIGVRGDQWFSPGCADAECCPDRLPPVPPGLAETLLAARRRAERQAAPSRVAGRRLNSRFDAARVWREALATGVVADAATARRLAAELDDLCVRDWVVLSLLGAVEAAEDALAGLESELVSRALDDALGGVGAPEEDAVLRARGVLDRVERAARGRRRKAAVNTLSAVLEWWDGNLAAAHARCDNALAYDATYRLAQLVGLAASRGIAPGWVVRSR